MGWTTVTISLIASFAKNVVAPHAGRAALLSALFLTASFPAGGVAGVAGGSRQSGPSIGEPNTSTGPGRQLVLQVRGRS
jgi:hypothetical protein